MSTNALATQSMSLPLISPVAPLSMDARLVPLLSAEEEQALGRRIQAARLAQDRLRRGDFEPPERAMLERTVADGREARRRFVEANQRLVINVARRYRGSSLDFEDLIQEGNLGLIRAVERF